MWILWQMIFTNQILQCQFTQPYGQHGYFINTQNETITSLAFQSNATFGLVMESETTFNDLFCIACMDLTSTNCNDYIGPCPRVAILLSFFDIRVHTYGKNISVSLHSDNRQLIWTLLFLDATRSLPHLGRTSEML